MILKSITGSLIVLLKKFLNDEQKRFHSDGTK